MQRHDDHPLTRVELFVCERLAHDLAEHVSQTAATMVRRLIADVKSLTSQRDRFHAALEWYAHASYERELVDRLGFFDPKDWQYSESEVTEDGGARARDALAGGETNVVTISENPPDVYDELKRRKKENSWDHIDAFLRVYRSARAGEWSWARNTRCKYIDLRVDMRDGGCIIMDRGGERILPAQLAWQCGIPPEVPT